MRKPLSLIPAFFLLVLSLQGQVTCTVLPADTIVCYNDSMAFRTAVTGAGPFTYQWQKNAVILPAETDSILVFTQVTPGDTGYYRCIVSNGIDRDTSNSGHLRMHPMMHIDTLYRYNALGCPGVCKGQFKVKVSGGAPPYVYNWGSGFSQDTLVFGLCPGMHLFKVSDTNNCVLSRDYFVDVLKLPKIDFTKNPDKDTIYLSNPFMTVQFPDTAEADIAGWSWNFGEDTTTVVGINPATHTYTKSGHYNISLSFTDLNGCDTTVQHELTVKVADVMVYNVFTPNKDGVNDNFAIRLKDDKAGTLDYRDAYISTELVVYDRWGKKVYEKSNYKSEDWDGSNHADGVYYYVLTCHGQYGDDIFRGSVTIIGSGFSSGP